VTTRVAESEDEKPHLFQLYQNCPNPFNAATTIRYRLEKPQSVTLTVFNLSGQEVTTLVDQVQEAGEHQTLFMGKV